MQFEDLTTTFIAALPFLIDNRDIVIINVVLSWFSDHYFLHQCQEKKKRNANIQSWCFPPRDKVLLNVFSPIKILTDFHKTVSLKRVSVSAVYTAGEAKTTKRQSEISRHGRKCLLDWNAPIKVAWRVIIKCLNLRGFKRKAFKEAKTICLHIKRLHVFDSVSLGHESRCESQKSLPTCDFGKTWRCRWS